MKTQFNKLSKTAITAFFIVMLQAITISATLAATITSAATGNWNNTATWVGGVIPGSGDDVIISEGHSIEVSDTRTALSLSVETNIEYYTSLDITGTGNLTLLNDLNLTSNDIAMEIRINVNGTMRVDGNINFLTVSSADARINLFTGANVTLYGAVVNSTQGQILGYSTSESNFIFAGSNSQTIPLHAGMRYYNITINKSGSNAASLGGNITATNVYNNITIAEGRLSNNNRTVTGNSGKSFTVEDGGIYVLTGTTALPVTFTHNFQSGSSVIFSSNSAQTVGVPNSGSYHNLSFEGSGTKTLGGNITSTGNINITAGTLDASASNYNISVAGNWNNTGGTFNARNATVTFNGSASQSISSNSNDFYNLVFNNTASGTSAIVLNSDITATNICTMTDGIISTGSNRLILTSTTAANLSGFSSACYINGNLRRYVANNTSTYSFPVGTGAYQRFDVKNNNMNGVTYIDASFSPLERHDDVDFAAENINDGGSNYISLSLSGMWTIDPNAQPSSGSYDAYAYITNISGTYDNDFAIVKRPTGSPDGSSWTTGGGTINATNGLGRRVSDGYALRMGLTSFSEFGIGSTQPSNPLPIQLVSFNAKLDRTGVVEINWVTATEINNDYFSVERSTNGISFEEIEVVSGAGNTSRTLTYDIIDEKPLTGVSYYRLKQTDYDGTVSYSNIVSINNRGAFTQHNWSLFPNPIIVGGNVNISGVLNKGKAEVYEAASGRIITSELIVDGSASIDTDNILGKGVYLVRILDENNQQLSVQKLIVQ